MYLYLDLIWLLNLAIDYLLLWMTAVFRQVDFKKWRLLLAAVIGSTYVLFLFFPALQSLYTFFVKLGLSVVLVWVAFGYGNIHRFAAHFFTFYFISFVTGGGLLAVHFILRSEHELMQGMVVTQSSGYGDVVSWWFVLLGFPLMYWFTHSRWNQIQKTKRSQDMVVEVDIGLASQRVCCKGLVDTGNRLYDPLTKTPVMMIESKAVQHILPGALTEIITTQKGVEFLDQHSLPQEWISRLKVVPYRGIRQQMELMITVKPDWVCIRKGEQEWCSKHVLLGLQGQTLAQDHSFEAIVHPDLLQEQYISSTPGQKEAM